MEQPGYEKRGYLHEDFHLFHLCDALREPVDWHYHTFHKLCVYLGGDAIRYGIEHGQPGDVIVLAGKGHEDYQEICGVKHPMDERVLIAEVLEELGRK